MDEFSNKRQFVKNVYSHVLPNYSVSPTVLWSWLPDSLCARLGRSTTRSEVLAEVDNEEVWVACFSQISSTVSRDWEKLDPGFASMLLDWIVELDLWKEFDQRRLKLSRAHTDLISFRFDLADVLFEQKKQHFLSNLQELHVDLDQNLILAEVTNNTPRIIDVFIERVCLRGNIDLAFAVSQKIPRSHYVASRIKTRVEVERQKQYLLLKDILKNSSLYQCADGRTFWGWEELPDPQHGFQVQQVVAERLELFELKIRGYVEQIDAAVPPIELVSECSAILERVAMSMGRKGDTIINISHSQVGLLNTGTMERIHTIEQSLVASPSGDGDAVRQALKEVSESVANSSEVKSDQMNDILDQINLLAKQVADGKKEKTTGVTKAVITSLADALSSFEKLSTIWAKWGPAITSYFGV